MKTWFLLGAVALPLLAAAPALAGPGRNCASSNLQGTYGLTTHGVRVGVFDTASPPAVHFYPAPLPTDLVTVETFDGQGNGTITEYVMFDGADLTHGFVGPLLATYQLNGDCTGTEIAAGSNGFVLQRAFVLSNGGRTVHKLWTAVHQPSLPPSALPEGVTCDPPTGCDLAVQFHSDGERF